MSIQWANGQYHSEFRPHKVAIYGGRRYSAFKYPERDEWVIVSSNMWGENTREFRRAGTIEQVGEAIERRELYIAD